MRRKAGAKKRRAHGTKRKQVLQLGKKRKAEKRKGKRKKVEG